MPVMKIIVLAKHVSQSFKFELFLVKMLQSILTYFLTLVSAKFKQEIRKPFFFSEVVGVEGRGGAASAEVASFPVFAPFYAFHLALHKILNHKNKT